MEKNLEKRKCDVIVIGAGMAGMGGYQSTENPGEAGHYCGHGVFGRTDYGCLALSSAQCPRLLLPSSASGTKLCTGAGGLQDAKQYFPEAREAARWSAQDCMPHDGVPFIGKYSIFTPHLYVATGFQKWGMTTSMVAAMILRDMLNGIQNPYARLFKPQRLLLRAGASAFLKDVGMSVKGLSQGWFGKKSLRCPHMGCKLTWNLHERSWDCPCHGSRFDAEGGLLDNPAIRPWTYFSKP